MIGLSHSSSIVDVDPAAWLATLSARQRQMPRPPFARGGAVALWLMNGATVVSTPGVGTLSTDWQIQGMNAD